MTRVITWWLLTLTLFSKISLNDSGVKSHDSGLVSSLVFVYKQVQVPGGRYGLLKTKSEKCVKGGGPAGETRKWRVVRRDDILQIPKHTIPSIVLHFLICFAAAVFGRKLTRLNHILDHTVCLLMKLVSPEIGLKRNSLSLFHKPIQVLNNLDQSPPG